MSYYGYPNPGAYNQNYQAYAAYAANASTYNQYQAAYNAAAYGALQQQVPPPPPPPPPTSTSQIQQNKPITPHTTTASGISISQPAQRYDYTQQQQQQQQQVSKTPSTTQAPTSSAAFYAQAYASSMFKPPPTSLTGQKWPQMGLMPPLTTTPGQLTTTTTIGQKKTNQFRQRRPGAQVQMFYCEVCKISCAGPQTYKEHLEGQKHKKKEALLKINEEKKNEVTSAPSDPTQNQNGTQMNQVQQQQQNFHQKNRFARTQNIIKCQLCDVACTGRDAYAAHIRGFKHQKTLKLHQKLGKPIPPELLVNQTPVQPQQPPAYASYPISSQPTIITKSPVQLNPNIKTLTPTQQSQTSPKTAFVSSTENKVVPNSNLTVINTIEEQSVVSNQPQLLTTNILEQDNEQFDNDSSNNEPIGKEYIETRMDGKILTFYCKLCDCKFNDPNAKDMHTKGRRHRLAYKKKVDPSLKVELRGPIKSKTQSRIITKKESPNGQLNQIKPLMSSDSSLSTTQGLQPLMSQPVKPITNISMNQYNYGSNQQQQNRNESFDDRHIIFKHNSIYPTQDEINAIQEIVTSTEKALKLVSDQIAEEENVAIKQEQGDQLKQTQIIQNDQPSQTLQTNEQENTEKPKEEIRTLKGVMRVGLLAKGLLLRGDTDVKLIVICSNKPTKTLLERVYKILLQKIEIVSPEIKYSVILDKEAETILIVRLTINEVQPLITCRVLLTSPTVREQLIVSSSITNNNNDKLLNNDLLDKQKCLDSLADLRHAKWFQAVASQIPNCVVIIRILRDLCRRNTTWAPLTQWALELLVERSLSSAAQALSPGEALRRVLECVSSGVLLPNEAGILDPCEKDPVDVTDNLTNQQREELTSSAHMAIRLLAFKQIFKILGIECINLSSNNRSGKKRQYDSVENEMENSPIEEKKEKKSETIENEKENLNSTIEIIEDQVIIKEEI